MMPGNTPIATAEDVRVLARLYYGYDGHVAGVDPYDEPKRAKYYALADALDALMKAQKGCGKKQWPFDEAPKTCGVNEYLCGSCYDAREAAIKLLVEGGQ